MKKDTIVKSATALTAVLAVSLALPAAAHHSFAVYDTKQTRSAEGTIKEFNFGAPHSSATFMIKGPDGKPQELTLQGAAPSALLRAGFNARDFSRGTKVELTWYPVKNGGPEGAMITMKLADGRLFKDQEARGAGGGPPGGGPPGDGPPGGGPPGP